VSTVSTIRTMATNPQRVMLELMRARRLKRAHPNVAATIERVRRDGLTYLQPVHLWGLVGALIDLDDRGVDGAVVETGTALGGSAILLATARRRPRHMLVFDAFGMIPPPSEHDGEDVHHRYDEIVAGKSTGIAGDTYYGYRNDLLQEVTGSFERYGVPPATSSVTLVPGLFEESLHVDEPVALVHIDCDWYDSVMVSLERIVPHVVPGGRLVIDDYWTWSGCRRAVNDFLRGRDDLAVERRLRLHLVKR